MYLLNSYERHVFTKDLVKNKLLEFLHIFHFNHCIHILFLVIKIEIHCWSGIPNFHVTFDSQMELIMSENNELPAFYTITEKFISKCLPLFVIFTLFFQPSRSKVLTCNYWVSTFLMQPQINRTWTKTL